MVLPDTSIWVAYLRTGAEGLTHELNQGLDVERFSPAAPSSPSSSPAHVRPARIASLTGLPRADLDHNARQSVGLLAAELRDPGQTLPLTDLEKPVSLWDLNPAVPGADGTGVQEATMTKTFSVRSERAGRVHRVVPCGELDLETVPVLESELDAVSAVDPALVIVVDLTELTFMDSTGCTCWCA